MIPIFAILLFAILLPGGVNRVRSWLSGRLGYRFFQPLYTVGVLLGKASVYSNTSSWLTRLVAPLYLSCTVVAALCIPFGSFGALVSFDGDFILFVYLLGLGRLILVLGALDSGSSFQGMGSSRELLLGMMAEPAYFLFFGTLSLITGHYSFSSVFSQFDNVSINLLVLSMLVGYGFFKLSLLECSRVPVDDTATHLELTMIHEVMVLDLSGVDLAFIKISGWIKLSIFGLLVANALVPAHITGPLLWLFLLLSMVVYVGSIGFIESMRARNRMNKNSTFLATIVSVALLSFVVAYLLSTNIFL
ncbi:MAG: NADH-quinone oxidoreductase subunit H [Mucinivorans sp.]